MMTPTESVVIANIMNIKNVNHRMTAMFWLPASAMHPLERVHAVFWIKVRINLCYRTNVCNKARTALPQQWGN
jgi:hypothetical protein